jgi:2-dehydropantoate 2-reductase
LNILVTGAGIIGTIYGWALSEAGNHVVHYVRPGKATRFGGGVPLDVFDRRKGHKRFFRGQYRMQVTEAVSRAECYDVVLVPTKHYQVEEALAQLVPNAGQADFLLLTQNWRGTERFDDLLPRTRYAYGDAKAGGTFAGETLVAALASIDLGPAEGAMTPLARKMASLMQSAAIPTILHEDMLHYLWVQYAILAGLWPALVRAGSMDRALRERQAGELGMRAVRECLEVVARRGVDLRCHPETRPFLRTSALHRWLGMQLFKLTLRYSEFVKRSSAHALDDPIEIKTFYDDLMTTGRELGVSMPVMSSYAQDIAQFASQNRGIGRATCPG